MGKGQEQQTIICCLLDNGGLVGWFRDTSASQQRVICLYLIASTAASSVHALWLSVARSLCVGVFVFRVYLVF